MTGVEILNEEMVYGTHPVATAFLLVCLIGAFGFLLIAGVCTEFKRRTVLICAIGGTLCLLALFVLVALKDNGTFDIPKYTKYEVTIDEDSVLFSEFYEKYEILDQKGKIYAVRERE